MIYSELPLLQHTRDMENQKDTHAHDMEKYEDTHAHVCFSIGFNRQLISNDNFAIVSYVYVLVLCLKAPG